jgi:hypothetical protein
MVQKNNEEAWAQFIHVMTMELIYYDPYLTTPGNKNSYSEQESNMVCYFGHLTVSKG